MATIHTLLTVVAGESICARCLRGLTNLRLSPPRLPGISAATIDRRLARVYAPGGGALSVGEILLTRARARSSPAAASARHATPGGQNLPRASFDHMPRKFVIYSRLREECFLLMRFRNGGRRYGSLIP